MKLLVVASAPMEFAGILRRAHGGKRIPSIPVDWSRLVRLGGNEMLLVAHGAGGDRAGRAVDAAASFQPDALVSTGFCGALAPQLQIADIVVATSVVADGATYPATLPAGGGACHRMIVRSVNRVIGSAPEKRALAASGAGAVEMEAASVASRAVALHLPFYCIRVVSDLAGEDLANDFNRALKSDGHFATIVLLRSALGRPLVRIPELIRLRKRCVRAARALGDFFADCRF